MNILIDLRVLTKGRSSGIEEYAKLAVSHLIQRNEKHYYSLFWNGFHKVPLPEDWDGLKKPNVSIIDWRIPNKLFDVAARFFNEPKIDRFFKIDAVWNPHLNIFPAGPRTKRVITFHDISFVRYPEFFSPRKRLWHWLQDWQRGVHSANKIIAVSEFTKAEMIECLSLPPEKIEIIHSGLNPIYRELRKEDEALLDFKNKHKLFSPFILFVGTLEPRKNVISLIKAWNFFKIRKSARDFKLLIAGSRGWFYRDIFREAASSPFREDIVFWGTARKEDLVFLYNLASIFVYPSFYEGFGFPPLEAQACGTTVIASRSSSFKEILGESAILIDPKNPQEIASAMEKLLDNDSVRRELKERGKRNVLRFDWNEATDKLSRLLESL